MARAAKPPVKKQPAKTPVKKPAAAGKGMPPWMNQKTAGKTGAPVPAAGQKKVPSNNKGK